MSHVHLHPANHNRAVTLGKFRRNHEATYCLKAAGNCGSATLCIIALCAGASSLGVAIRRVLLLAMMIMSIIFSQSAFASKEEVKTIRIAAGSILEGYYAIGLKLCRYISEANQGIECDVVPTNGSIENIKLLRTGAVDFAFAQSNLALDAYKGEGHFLNADPFVEMIQLLKLHDEVLTVIAKDKDKILLFGDIDGRKISNGPGKSGSALIYLALSSYYDFKKDPEDIEMAHEDYAKSLCDGKIDAIIMMTGHPNALVNFITHSCDCDFVGIENEKLERFIRYNPAFKPYTISNKGYPGISKSQKSVATSAIFISRKSVPEEIVANFLNYFESRIDQFRLSDPLLNNLGKDDLTSGFILPGFKDTK